MKTMTPRLAETLGHKHGTCKRFQQISSKNASVCIAWMLLRQYLTNTDRIIANLFG